MVDITSDNKAMNDLYLLFKRREDIKAYVAHQLEPEGKFRACDWVDLSRNAIQHNGVSDNDVHSKSIKTFSILDFDSNDYVYNVKTRQVWKIDTFSLVEDKQMKEYSMRPRKYTILNLIR